MLTFVVGSNGSGKSLFAMHKLIEELRFGNRQIVTTLALDMPELNDYCQRTWPNETIDVYGRILMIGKEQLGRYWRYRGVSAFGEYGQEAIERGEFGGPDWNEYHADNGVLYILDEIEVGFGTREWQRNGLEFTKYQPQHRKFTDDVWAISPASGLVDKQYRLLCNNCVVLQNQYQLRIGLLKAPRKIVARWYLNAPPEKGEPHMTKEEIHIDGKGLAKCYKTEGGIGVCGRNADKGKEARGIPWYFIFPAGLGAAVLTWLLVSRMLGFSYGYGMKKLAVSGEKGAKSVATNLVAAAEASGHGMPGFGNWTGGNTAPKESVKQKEKAPASPILIDNHQTREELPQFYGWGRMGRLAVLDTSYGMVHGTNLVVQGLYAWLDGVKFQKAMRSSPGPTIVQVTSQPR